MSSTVNLCLTFSLSQEFAVLHLGISCAHNVLAIYALFFYFKLRGEKSAFLSFVSEHHKPCWRGLSAQSSGAVGDQHDAFPSGDTSRYGVQKEPPWEYSGAEQGAAAIQMLGCGTVGGFCATHAVQVQLVVQRKGEEQVWSFASPQVNLPLVLWIRWYILSYLL